ncbi:MAG: ABC transporter permease [Planctomycetota bacterium]
MRTVLRRLCWMPVTLLGIAFVTFLLLDVVPSDRAVLELQQGQRIHGEAQVAALRALRIRYGLIDAETGEPRPVLARFGSWCARAATFDLAPPGETAERFRFRFVQALATSALLGVLALIVALGLGVMLGAWWGARAARPSGRIVGGLALALSTLPEFLVATLLLLFLGGGVGPAVLPAVGLQSPGADALSGPARLADLLAHLALPVATLALVPTVTVARFVAEGLGRALEAEFAHAMRGLGCDEHAVRRRALRHALSPVWTLLGVLVPSLLTGTVVVEQVFSIQGFGRLTLDGVLRRDVATTMASTLSVAVLVLFGLLVSDVLHRLADPRVELERR